MTVQVNHKKLYYNYYTLGKYLLKIQISGKILRHPPPPPPPTVKLRQKSGKIPVKILIFSGKICVIK
jgi:hypothetical protein